MSADIPHSRTPLYPLRRGWLFDVARELQLLAGELAQADRVARADLIERVLGRMPPPETDLEQWFMTHLVRDAGRAGVHDGRNAGDRPVPRVDTLGRAIAELLSTRYGEAWTLRRMADTLHRHPSTIEREMKRAFGLTVHAFLTDCRMRAAKRLLVESTWKIEAVGREVGYRSKKNFYEEFRRATGMTPMNFRRSALRHAS